MSGVGFAKIQIKLMLWYESVHALKDLQYTVANFDNVANPRTIILNHWSLTTKVVTQS